MTNNAKISEAAGALLKALRVRPAMSLDSAEHYFGTTTLPLLVSELGRAGVRVVVGTHKDHGRETKFVHIPASEREGVQWLVSQIS